MYGIGAVERGRGDREPRICGENSEHGDPRHTDEGIDKARFEYRGSYHMGTILSNVTSDVPSEVFDEFVVRSKLSLVEFHRY